MTSRIKALGVVGLFTTAAAAVSVLYLSDHSGAPQSPAATPANTPPAVFVATAPAPPASPAASTPPLAALLPKPVAEMSDGELATSIRENPVLLRETMKFINGELTKDWKYPISFFGKVVDEKGQPLEGAHIKFVWNDLSPKGTSEKETQSDGEGAFSLEGATGKGMSVYVTKTGYYSSEQSRGSFEYASRGHRSFHVPDPANPVVFRLHKKGVIEPLERRQAQETLAYDGGSYYYDLQSGAISQQPPSRSGLKISFTRTPNPRGKPFDWTWRIEGINVALQATTEELPFLAPAQGYAATWETSQSAQDRPFRRSGKVCFYLRTADGRYARADLNLDQFNARERGATLSVKSWLNPSCSRNLEFDPSKRVPAR